jgi:hypothetical protein
LRAFVLSAVVGAGVLSVAAGVGWAGCGFGFASSFAAFVGGGVSAKDDLTGAITIKADSAKRTATGRRCFRMTRLLGRFDCGGL